MRYGGFNKVGQSDLKVLSLSFADSYHVGACALNVH
jgi:hypothetical protein